MDALTLFVVMVVFTLTTSAFCSLLEAMLLSTTKSDLEALKQRAPKRGALMESFREDLEGTSSAILTLNTVANTLGATMAGAIAATMWAETHPSVSAYVVPLGLTLAILIFSEILPKNLGVLYRPSLLPIMVYPLAVVRKMTGPISFLAGGLVRALSGKPPEPPDGADEDEIKMLAERSAVEGNLTASEMAIITNALSLDDLRVHEIMTPRTVVEACDADETVAAVIKRWPNIPFARLPVFDESIDKVVGIVRRRELLKAKAEDRDEAKLRDLMHPAMFLPETASGSHALEQFLRAHQQLAVVVDEFGSVAGVITMEDLMEHLLGQEIFEKDDIAIDMRDLARRRERIRARRSQRERDLREAPQQPEKEEPKKNLEKT